MEIIKCPHCGFKINKKMKMCIKCGYIMESYKEETPHRHVKKNTKFSFYVHRLLVVILILLIIGGVIWYRNFTEKRIENWITPIEELTLDRSKPYYVNDLYYSDDRAYNHLLNQQEKDLYAVIFKAIKEHQTSITINPKRYRYPKFYNTRMGIQKVQDALAMDHPELIQFSSLSPEEIDEDKVNIHIRYVLSQDQYQSAVVEVETVLNEIKKNVENKSIEEKVKYVYAWLGEKNRYASVNNNTAYSSYSALILGNSVSDGFAKASQLLLQRVGVNSILLTGTFEKHEHVWNYVELEGKYYHFDATQACLGKESAGGTIVYTGLLMENTIGYQYHHSNIVPKNTGKKYFYYRMNHTLYEYNKKTTAKLEEMLNRQGEYAQVEITNLSYFKDHFHEVQNKFDIERVEYIRNVAIFKKIKKTSDI